VYEGASGRELRTVVFDQAREDVGAWGDTYGNRVDRFLATAAYLDDSGLPSFVMARGYYTRTTLTAWTWRGGQLTQLWKFDSNVTPADAQGRPFTNQGAHSLSVANTDADPEQEIIYGAMTVDHDGTGKCSSGRNHGDALHVTDLIPSRPGQEVFMPAETRTMPYWSLRDADNCDIIHSSDQTGMDVGRGVAGDVTADSPGGEFWSSRMVLLHSATTGMPIGPQPLSQNFLAWWDADETRELEDATSVTKYGVAEPLLSCAECASNNGTKATPALVADLLGDWREEVIWRELDNTALRIYTTTDVTARRIYTLMHDPQYRIAISWQNVAYNQPPHPSFHIGADMAAPPTPDIRLFDPSVNPPSAVVR
jgi:rhamnogalacturonan endolyase